MHWTMATTGATIRALCLCASLSLVGACGFDKVPSDSTTASAPQTPMALASAASPGAKQAVCAAPCTSWTQASDADCKLLCVDQNPLLVVGTDGTASGVMRICNRGMEPVIPDLLLTDFTAVRSDGTAYQLGAAATLSPDDEKSKPALEDGTPLPKDGCISVKISVSKLWQAGLLTAELKNRGKKVIDVKAIRILVPFHLKVAGPTPEKVVISFTRDGPNPQIELRNEDPMSYRFLWRFELDGEVLANGTRWVQPRDVVKLDVENNLIKDKFAWLESGFLRSGARSGELYLKYEPEPSFGDLDLPSMKYPVEARLNYWAMNWQTIINAFFVLLVLFLGICLSLLINYALPIQRKRIAIKERLANQEGRLAGLGSVVQSRTLSLLRSERRRLRAELSALFPVDPATEAALTPLEARIDWLDLRIELTIKVGGLLSAINSDSDLAQPEIDALMESCRAVLDIVEKPSPQPEEIKTAQTQVQLASAILADSHQKPTPELVGALQRRYEALPQSIVPADDQDDADTWKQLDDLFKAQFRSKKDPTREEYVRASKAVTKAELIVKFRDLVMSSGNPGVRKMRINLAGKLLNALLPGADESVQGAFDIVCQTEQNVSTDELLDAIRSSSPNDLWIEVDPPAPTPRHLVTFRVHMRRSGFDAAVARKDIECAWKVDGKEIEAKGFTVCDYFEDKHQQGDKWQDRVTNKLKQYYAKIVGNPPTAGVSYKVEAILRYSGADLLSVGSKQVELEQPKSYGESKTTYAIIALLVTVGIVGIGLQAGAQEKLQSLDWWAGLGAILVLGFSADALKRVLTKP